MSSGKKKQNYTHLTFGFPPHLPEPHPYSGGVSHGPCRCIHGFVGCLRINHPQSKDPPEEPLMRIVWLFSPEPLQLFVTEEGLHPEVVIHSKSLEFLGQWEVHEDHVVYLNSNGLVFV